MKLLVIFKVNFATKLGLQLSGLQNPLGPARQQAAPPSGFKNALLKLDLEIWMSLHLHGEGMQIHTNNT